MTTTDQVSLGSDELLLDLTAMAAWERIDWAADHFGSGLYVLSSFGPESALMLELIAFLNLQLPVIHIDTGFLRPEVVAYREQLRRIYGFRLHVFGPSPSVIRRHKLGEPVPDMDRYREETRGEPLRRAIDELDVACLISGVRQSQTMHRSTLPVFVPPIDSPAARLHPILHFSDHMVDRFLHGHHLPRHPLHDEGRNATEDTLLLAAGLAKGYQTECSINGPATISSSAAQKAS